MPELNLGHHSIADLAASILRASREIRLGEQNSPEYITLTPSLAQVIRFIGANPGSLPSEIAEVTGLRRSNLSAALRELQGAGFVERRADPNDGRSVRLFATQAAKENLLQIRRSWIEMISEALGEDAIYLEADIERTITLLNTLTISLERRRLDRGMGPGRLDN